MKRKKLEINFIMSDPDLNVQQGRHRIGFFSLRVESGSTPSGSATLALESDLLLGTRPGMQALPAIFTPFHFKLEMV